jgi:hypothetical protein
MSMSSVPCRIPTRCCACFAMEDIRPRSRDDGRHSTVDCQGTKQSLDSVPKTRKLSRWPLKIPGNLDDDDALVAPQKEQDLQELSSLVVKWRLPPMANHEFGDQYSDLAVRVRVFNFQDVIDQGHEHEAVGERSRTNSCRPETIRWARIIPSVEPNSPLEISPGCSCQTADGRLSRSSRTEISRLEVSTRCSPKRTGQAPFLSSCGLSL